MSKIVTVKETWFKWSSQDEVMVQGIIEINIIAICDFSDAQVLSVVGKVGKESNQTPAKTITIPPSCIFANILALSNSQGMW